MSKVSLPAAPAAWPALPRAIGISRPQSIATAINCAFRSLRKSIRTRHDASVLASLDDRMLRDIGIERFEIPRAARFGRHDVLFGKRRND